MFVVIHRRLSDFDETRGSLRTWIYGICLRTASQYRRRILQRREAYGEGTHIEPLMAEQEDALERKRAREMLHLALQELDDDERTAFVLYDLDELPMREVAASFGWPLQTAYSRLRRARRQVEAAFRALAARPSPSRRVLTTVQAERDS